MKTVKIILKFKFLTLFSDKIIQCYTESTVYTIITLFLYGIGAILCSPFCKHVFFYYIIPIWNWSDNISEAFIYDVANLIKDLEIELSGDSNITNYKINDISYNFDKPNITSKISNIVYRWF